MEISCVHSAAQYGDKTTKKFNGQRPQIIKDKISHTPAAKMVALRARKAKADNWGFIKASGAPQGKNNKPKSTIPSKFPKNNTQIVGKDKLANIMGKGELLYWYARYITLDKVMLTTNGQFIFLLIIWLHGVQIGEILPSEKNVPNQNPPV